MATEERDSTADWIVPAERRPPSAFELQRQIEVATAVARAAEEAAMEIGQASLEAAEQARRAAVHAERSAEASVAAARAVSARADAGPGRLAAPGPVEAAPDRRDEPAGHELIPGSELPVAWSPVSPAPARPARPTAQPDPFDERMIAFRLRAERVVARLVRLEAAPPVS